MTLEEYAKLVDLFSKTEIEKVRFLAYYMLERQGVKDFTPKEVEGWFGALQLARPNRSRLRRRLVESRHFVKGNRQDSFALEARQLEALRDSYPEIIERSDEVIAPDVVLPESLYRATRGYIECLARQINASYEYNIFDGCAVLMRRLVEVLLILAYQHNGNDHVIQDDYGNYVMLERIVADAKNNGILRPIFDTLLW